jgi:hypothetical protein
MNSDQLNQFIISESRIHQKFLAASCITHAKAIFDIAFYPADPRILKSIEEFAWKELEFPGYELQNLTELALKSHFLNCEDDSGLEGYQLYIYHAVCMIAKSIYNESVEDLIYGNKTLRIVISGFDSKSKTKPHLDFKNPERLYHVESEICEQFSILPSQQDLLITIMREKAILFSQILNRSILGNEKVVLNLIKDKFPGMEF